MLHTRRSIKFRLQRVEMLFWIDVHQTIMPETVGSKLRNDFWPIKIISLHMLDELPQCSWKYTHSYLSVETVTYFHIYVFLFPSHSLWCHGPLVTSNAVKICRTHVLGNDILPVDTLIKIAMTRNRMSWLIFHMPRSSLSISYPFISYLYFFHVRFGVQDEMKMKSRDPWTIFSKKLSFIFFVKFWPSKYRSKRMQKIRKFRGFFSSTTGKKKKTK